MSPWIDRAEPGVVVPIPTLPVFSITKSEEVAVAVDEATSNSLRLVSPSLP